MSHQTIGVHIGTIQAGDRVEVDGEIRTVRRQDIRRSAFLGVFLFGDDYRSGGDLVRLVVDTHDTQRGLA